MVKVNNWLDGKQIPQTIRKEDMIYALGCMSYLLMLVIQKVKDLLEKQGQLMDMDYSIMIDEFEKGTFGKQIKLLLQYYSGLEISEEKMKKIRDERNYFIHNYEFGCSYADAKRMYDLLNLMSKMLGSLDNANQRMDRCNKKKKNQTRNQLKNDLRSAISRCKMHDGYVYLSDIGAQLVEMGCKPEGKLQDILLELGYEVYQSSDDKKVRWIKTQ